MKPGGAKAVWFDYGYDARRKIASVADLDGVGGNESRTYAYDANGRLLTAALIRDILERRTKKWESVFCKSGAKPKI